MQNPIEVLRKTYGLTRQQLAKQATLANSTIQAIASGHLSHLGPISSVKLSRVFGVDPQRLQEHYDTWRASLATPTPTQHGAGTNTMTGKDLATLAAFHASEKPIFIVKKGQKIPINITFAADPDGVHVILKELAPMDTRSNIEKVMLAHNLK